MVNIATLAVVFAAAVSVTATNFHVNRGCVLIDGRRICENQSTWVAEGNGNPGSVGNTKYSKSRVRARLGLSPECEKDFFWPAYYGDIYYGADDCLYDAPGWNIRDMNGNPQCC